MMPSTPAARAATTSAGLSRGNGSTRLPAARGGFVGGEGVPALAGVVGLRQEAFRVLVRPLRLEHLEAALLRERDRLPLRAREREERRAVAALLGGRQVVWGKLWIRICFL